MRDFSFVKTDHPTMAEFNKRFNGIADFVNNIGNEYVWTKGKYAIRLTPQTGMLPIVFTGNYTGDVKYADDVSMDSNGNIELVNPVTVTASSLLNSNDFLAGKYYINPITGDNRTNGKLLKFDDDAKFHVDTGVLVADSGLNFVTSEMQTIGYVNSPDYNAYPVDDGHVYTALGQFGAKVQIARGSYVGTGSGVVTLTLPFEPAYGIVQSYRSDVLTVIGVAGSDRAAMINNGASAGSTSPHFGMTFNGNVVTISADQNYSMNISGRTYYYVFLG